MPGKDWTPRTYSAWKELYPFESRWKTVAGRQMHYVDQCHAASTPEVAPTLLFVHGNPTWSFHWRELIKTFRPDYRCVAIDHLGCGLSEKGGPPLRLAERIDHLVEFIDRLQLDRITLVAQDWGGAIGLGAMLQRRDVLERIVLFNTGAFPPPFFPLRIRVCRTPLLGRLALQGFNGFSRAALRMTLSRAKRLPALVEQAYLAPYDNWQNRQAVYDFVADIPPSPKHPTWATLSAIETGLPELASYPVCLIWGMQDWCFRPECLERFIEKWPQAEDHRLQDVGHWVVEDAPTAAQQKMAAFLKHSSLAEGSEDSAREQQRA